MQLPGDGPGAALVHVSILIRPEGRMQPWVMYAEHETLGFQSSSGQKAGCNRVMNAPERNIPIWFQSSSGQKAGCNASWVSGRGCVSRMFQSSSGQKAGCNRYLTASSSPRPQVSILIRPEGRMQPVETKKGDVVVWGVSILIRPEGRMQRRGRRTDDCSGGFNPHPARRPDATCGGSTTLKHLCGFNPHPARRPDATRVALCQRCGLCVSILIRPEGRMQLGGSADFLYFGRVLFQSSSGQKAGCNGEGGGLTMLRWFQSSSGQKAGCNSRASAYHESLYPFQSSSGQKAGCNLRPEGRMQLMRTGRTSLAEGRMQHGQVAVNCLFQSSSGQKAGCLLIFIAKRAS